MSKFQYFVKCVFQALLGAVLSNTLAILAIVFISEMLGIWTFIGEADYLERSIFTCIPLSLFISVFVGLITSGFIVKYGPSVLGYDEDEVNRFGRFFSFLLSIGSTFLLHFGLIILISIE